jgi:hypothetical protein
LKKSALVIRRLRAADGEGKAHPRKRPRRRAQKQLHEELDAAVLDAYGWHGPAEDEQTLLARLVALNAERRAEEAAGTIRWLRPDIPEPASGASPHRAGDRGRGARDAKARRTPRVPRLRPAQPFRKPGHKPCPNNSPPSRESLPTSPTAQTEAQLAARFTGKGRWKSRLPDILAALEALGRARRVEDGRWMG